MVTRPEHDGDEYNYSASFSPSLFYPGAFFGPSGVLFRNRLRFGVSATDDSALSVQRFGLCCCRGWLTRFVKCRRLKLSMKMQRL